MMTTSDTIKVRFSYTFSDWAYATLFYNLHASRDICQVLIPVAWVSLGVYYLWASKLHRPIFWFGVFFVLFGIIDWLGLLSLLGFWIRLKQSANKPPRVYEFAFDETEACYSYRTPTSIASEALAWTEFKEFMENKRSFLLVRGRNSFWALPKHYFSSDTEINAFRELTKRTISATGGSV